ncbi:hypothetical protein ISN76_12985 [Dyella halodurans]|uniref:HNH endonuclease n=1 Tax=Dyella halodurans TaxID=1920171 RepID=A0ABV9C0F4_9GAMM|nr:hypothetical protein [Dyella halodurans]
MTAEHVESRTLKDFVVDPDHDQRTESPEFRHTKKRLHDDGHMQCWVCGSLDKLQVHHLFCEYMFANVVDYDNLKAMAEEWDVYGYGRLLKKQPVLTPDDIRNMMVLCQTHHTGVSRGIHDITFPTWISQKMALKGACPVPMLGETFDQAMARIKKHERT